MPQLEASHLQIDGKYGPVLQGLFATHVPNAEIWAYGSRVNGGAHEGSDLDLVLRDPADLQRVVSGADDLREALQQSTLPMLVDVHQWAHLPEAFRREIERAYVVLQGSPIMAVTVPMHSSLDQPARSAATQGPGCSPDLGL